MLQNGATISSMARHLQRWATWIENEWNNNPLVAWTLVLLGIASAVYFYYFPQLPGVCIGILGLVAGIMSVRPGKMHVYEKMAWIALLIAFAVFEVLAIKRGDLEYTAKNQVILDGMTGGDDYLFFSPLHKNSKTADDDQFSIQVSDSGNNTVRDALVEMQEGESTDPEHFIEGYHPTKIPIGSVSSTYATGLGDVIIHPLRDRQNFYTFRVFARNMPTIEQLGMSFNQESKKWECSYWIWRYLPKPKIGVELLSSKEHQPVTSQMIVPLNNLPVIQR